MTLVSASGAPLKVQERKPFVSIDPGLRACGIAFWDKEGTLVKAFLAKGDDKLVDARAWAAMVQGLGYGTFAELTTKFDLVIEFPQVYPGYRENDNNDLLQLAAVVGAVSSYAHQDVTVYRPRQWKRQVPKKVMVERIQGRLSEEETKLVSQHAPSLMHNVWDAIGIGLYHVDRL